MKQIITLFSLMIFSYSVYFSQCNVIYVTPTGTGTGTKASPSSLLNAINVLTTTGDHIKLDTGLYVLSNPITSIPDSLIIEGGFVSLNNWSKTSLAGATRIFRDASNLQDAGLATVRISGFELSNVNGFRFQDFTIQTDNAPVATTYGVSVYGIYLNGCSNYNIVRCQVMVGDASKGVDGNIGSGGWDGWNGNNGTNGNDDSRVYAPGGSGGQGVVGNTGGTAGPGYSSGSSGSGGNGGNGTTSLTYIDGGAGGGGGGGGNGDSDGGFGGYGGGVASLSGCFTSYSITASRGQKGVSGGGNPQPNNCVAPGSNSISGGDGIDGADGANGCAGSAGPVGVKAIFWASGAKAGDGTDGQGGQGGAGGGGGAGEGNCFPCSRGSGAGGGGGGGGGQGGTSGTGAYGGGSTYAVYVYNNGANSLINDCFFTTGAAGLGGSGGAGGAAGLGGDGGAGGVLASGQDYEVGCGGQGGAGGAGGLGGNGGAGSPGEAMTIFVNGTALTTQDVGFNLAAQPVIAVDEKFCAGDSVNFSASVAGLWIFGSDATVASATGTNASTTYKQGGRKDINYNGQSYASFAYISVLSPSLAYAGKDSIACTSITLYADSVLSGSGIWSAITPGVVIASPTVHNSSVTLVNGLNQIEWVVSYGSCCPPTRDTVEIYQNTPATDPVSVFSLKDTVCYGDSAKLIVQGGSLGTDGQWIWYADSCSGSPVGIGDTVSFNITTNITYFVRAESSCGNTICVSKSLIVNAISVAADSIISSADTLCRYDSVILTALGGSLLPGDDWNWYESSCGGVYVGTGTSITVAPVNNATYFVRGEGASCKPTTCVSKIIIVKGAVVSLIPFDTICGVLQPVILNNANPSGGYYSGTGVTNGTFDPVIADYGNHIITYTYTDLSSGCVQAVYDTLVVSSACANIESVLVVNTFSPNGDGTNDTWNLNLGNYTKSRVTVFNKWGLKIFESNERIIQWDGTNQGKPLPAGSYFYVVEIDDRDPYQGSITIVR